MKLRLDDRVLHGVACPVDTSDRFRLARIERALLATMRSERGVGLAAPQCGLALRVFAVGLDVGAAMFNPVVTEASTDLVEGVEGCLSLPGERRMVPRPRWIDVSWTDSRGRAVSGRAEGLLARVIRHEADHLDGLLINRYPRPPGPPA